jgi:Uri superfamily endonuclease
MKTCFMKSQPGTYALILQSHSKVNIQIGRWRQIDIQRGYYIYVGSAFGPGGVQARVLRHLRVEKLKHWHIDYLREYVSPQTAWVSYDTEKLEHRWAQIFFERNETSAIQGFGCSDCKCHTHLFHTLATPDVAWLGTVDLFCCYALDEFV